MNLEIIKFDLKRIATSVKINGTLDISHENVNNHKIEL